MVRVQGVVDTIILNNSTPIDDETVDVRFSYLQRRTEDPRTERIGQAMLRDLKKQMEQNPEQNQDNKDDQDSQNKEDENKDKSQQQDSK